VAGVLGAPVAGRERRCGGGRRSFRLDEAAYRNSGAVRLVPSDARRRARASLADQLDRRALRDARVEATEDAVMITVGGSVNFSLLQIASPGDEFAISVHATARPQASR